jgi:signal transduction histidine kinase
MAIEEDLMIGGDRQLLEELLSALCLHAIQTTPCGRVLVTARRRGPEIAVTISDDGIGMTITRTAEVMKRAREMLSLLGGKIEIERERGVGTTATILLLAHTAPWNATIQNAMADFARVTAPRERTPSEPTVAAYPS